VTNYPPTSNYGTFAPPFKQKINRIPLSVPIEFANDRVIEHHSVEEQNRKFVRVFDRYPESG